MCFNIHVCLELVVTHRTDLESTFNIRDETIAISTPTWLSTDEYEAYETLIEEYPYYDDTTVENKVTQELKVSYEREMTNEAELTNEVELTHASEQTDEHDMILDETEMDMTYENEITDENEMTKENEVTHENEVTAITHDTSVEELKITSDLVIRETIVIKRSQGVWINGRCRCNIILRAKAEINSQNLVLFVSILNFCISNIVT